MNETRGLLENVDLSILQLLLVRQQIADQTETEPANHQPTDNSQREQNAFARLRFQASELGLDLTMVTRIFRIIFSDSARRQRSRRRQVGAGPERSQP